LRDARRRARHELQQHDAAGRRGLFRSEYEGETLRAHFGLARPVV